MESTVSGALAVAFEHHRRGRLAEADAAYRRVLESTPDEPEALHRLGIIAHQLGRNELALQLIDRATAINPLHPTYHHDAGIVLHALGRLDDACNRYRKALLLEPNYPRAHNGLGIALKDQGRLDESAASFRAAVSLRPDYIEAWNNLGNVVRALGNPAEALRIFRRLLELRSSSPHLWMNVGGALLELGAAADAARACQRALALEPNLANARATLGNALLALGRPDEAAESFAIALRLEETPDAIAGFVRSLAAADLRGAGSDVRSMAIRALSTPWSRPSNLAAPAIRLFASDAAVRACIDRSWDAWPTRLRRQELFGESEPTVFDDPLLRILLTSAPVCDLQVERFLTMARSALLESVDAEGGPAGASALAFSCALARQSFINDYVFSCTDAELAGARELRGRLVASFHRGDLPSAMAIAIVAAYFPLHGVPLAEALLTRAWPEPVDALLTQQLREPLEERRWHERIPRITAVDDEVSLRVRQQYEEHPYPKWVKLPRADPGVAGGLAAATGLPRGPEAGDAAPALDILVAGCGTGQESIEVAQRFPDARVLAIDLSLASLAYAARKAQELQITNVEHAQADILRLEAIGRRFDEIYSVGVLHHLADPVRGLRTLASLLAPSGRMLVGLYSEKSRQDVVAARTFIAEHGYTTTDADIRRCRQDLMSVDRGARFSRLASRADFYVTSECRDLLFHVQEHRFTLPELRSMLAALDLRFDGFVLSPQLAARYQARRGSAAALDDVAGWEAFEEDFPDAFAGMYIFRVRKDA
jgi:Flp pilus assembly protein TadD/2-polyprenyl-3-methyl-5-hydroxy-6-metoxy-1,4-benzoquinol methylase